jgi:hypothetical protein
MREFVYEIMCNEKPQGRQAKKEIKEVKDSKLY